MLRPALYVFPLLAIVVGCGSGPSVRQQDQPPSTTIAQNDTSVLDALQVLTANAAWRQDSTFCDSLLDRYADTTLARTRREVFVALFFDNVMSHRAFQYGTMARLKAIAEGLDDEVLRHLHQYLLGRHLQIIGDPQGALRILVPLLPYYVSAGDTGGVASVAKRIGYIHAMDLDQPAEAIPYFRQALNAEWVLEDRCDIALFLGRCFTELGLPDSVEHYADFLEQVRLSGSLDPNPGPRPVGYRDQLRFNALALRAANGSAYVDSLRSYFDRAMVAYPPKNGLLPTTDYLDPHTHWELQLRFGKSLISAGHDQEAERFLAHADLAFKGCTGCESLNIELYRTLAELHRTRGDERAALHYQDLRIAAMERSGVEHRRREMERVEAATAFEREQAAFAASRATEQAQAQAALQRVRTQRAVAIVVALLVLVIAGLLLNRYRLRRRLHVEQLRARLSRDLHDDIGSTLSSISILSNVARKRTEATGDAEATASLDKISERSQRLMRNMSDIVWSVDPKKDSLEELIVRMRGFATSVLAAKGIATTFELPAEVPSIALAAGTKSNLYLLFKEAINNVVKHASAHNVHVSIGFQDRTLLMEVKDDGIGMDPEAPTVGHGGNGLRNMRERVREMNAVLHIDGASGTGSVVRVTLRV